MDYKAAETDCLSHLELDFLPFHDVFRSLFGHDQLMPNKQQFDEALKLFQSLAAGHKLRVLLSLKKEVTITEAVETLITAYEYGSYEAVNYSIWLSKH